MHDDHVTSRGRVLGWIVRASVPVIVYSIFMYVLVARSGLSISGRGLGAVCLTLGVLAPSLVFAFSPAPPRPSIALAALLIVVSMLVCDAGIGLVITKGEPFDIVRTNPGDYAIGMVVLLALAALTGIYARLAATWGRPRR